MLKCCCGAALILLSVLPCRAQIPAADEEGLKGQVETIWTETFNDLRPPWIFENSGTFAIFDRQENLIEYYMYDGNGSVTEHSIFTHEGSTTHQRTTGLAEIDPRLVERTYDSEGNLLEMEQYDADGVLTEHWTRERTNSQGESDCLSPDLTLGGWWPLRNAGRQDTSKCEWTEERDDQGHIVRETVSGPDGSHQQVERLKDGAMMTTMHFGATDDSLWFEIDAKGNRVEYGEVSGSISWHEASTYDESGRMTGRLKYNGSGKIIGKWTTEYWDDAHGNWIEKRESAWEMEKDDVQASSVRTSVRTIEYY